MEFVVPSEHPHINVLLYGPSKTSKSTGAGSAPGPVLFFNTDLKNATRYVHYRNKANGIMEIKIPPYEPGKHPVFDLMTEIAKEVAQPHDDIHTIVIDPIGELHRRLMEEFSQRAIRPSINIYGDVSIHIERFCRFLCEADVNVVIVAHEIAVKDEDSGEVTYMPFTGTSNPAVGQKLLGMVDIVGYTGVVLTDGEAPRYVAQLISGKGRRGGDRFACLGQVRDLNLTEWVQVIEANEKPSSSPSEEKVTVHESSEETLDQLEAKSTQADEAKLQEVPV